MSSCSVRRLQAISPTQLDELASVLKDCVDGGASVGFMLSLERDAALAFWSSVASAVDRGERALLVVEDALGICATAQLILKLPQNQPHRADLAKMLVHRRARRLGLGTALVRAAEAEAKRLGRTLLTLDTETGGDGERLYARMGWIKFGEVPGYAYRTDLQTQEPASFFYKVL